MEYGAVEAKPHLETNRIPQNKLLLSFADLHGQQGGFGSSEVQSLLQGTVTSMNRKAVRTVANDDASDNDGGRKNPRNEEQFH